MRNTCVQVSGAVGGLGGLQTSLETGLLAQADAREKAVCVTAERTQEVRCPLCAVVTNSEASRENIH